jgi:hypothetical protein
MFFPIVKLRLLNISGADGRSFFVLLIASTEATSCA